jgi:hypothetical protein
MTVSIYFISKEIELEVNAYKTKYTVTSSDQNAGRSHSINLDSSSFETAEELKYRVIKKYRLNSENIDVRN